MFPVLSGLGEQFGPGWFFLAVVEQESMVVEQGSIACEDLWGLGGAALCILALPSAVCGPETGSHLWLSQHTVEFSWFVCSQIPW